jgi:hypothetical protein
VKIKGKVPEKPKQLIELACGESIMVTAPPLGVAQRALKAVPAPSAPQKLVHKKGQPPAYLTNDQDPAFLAAEREANYLQAVYMVWEGLKDSEDVQFDTPVPDDGPDLGFVESIMSEMQKANLVEKDIVAIAKFVGKTAGGTKEELADLEGFSE